MGDRSGGRESKGSSLKASKKNPGSVVAKAKKAKVEYVAGSKVKLPPPQPLQGKYFDMCCAVLSRQYDTDRDRILTRAVLDGVSGIVCWFADIDKLETLTEFCRANKSLCYFLAGIHPDSIDRTNKKLQDAWLLKIDEFARDPECIGLLSGLNLSREVGTHFAQESIIRATYAIAKGLSVPFVLHISDRKSLERLIDILFEEGWGGREADIPIVLHEMLTAARYNPAVVRTAVDAGFYISVSTTPNFFDPTETANVKSCLEVVPLQRLLVASNSPWNTPQNIPDKHICGQRNEPSNIPYTYAAIGALLTPPVSTSELADAIQTTFMNLFHLGSDKSDKSERSAVIGEESATEINEVKSIIEELNIKDAQDVEKAEEVTQASDLKDVYVSPSPAAAPLLAQYYRCMKCRHKLFDKSSSIVHDIGEVKTVFRMGEVSGSCSAVIFLPNELLYAEGGQGTAGTDGDGDGRALLSTDDGKTVACANCAFKIGKRSDGAVQCPCGALVGGPVLWITTAKVDYIDHTISTSALAVQSIKELNTRTDNGEEDALGNEAYSKKLEQKQMKKEKKKKKEKSENKGNFSSYRNKSFVPNASRSQATASSGNKGNKKGGSDQSGDEHSSEDEEPPVARKGGKFRGNMFEVYDDNDA